MRAENGRKKSMSYTQPSTVQVVVSPDNRAVITFAENIQIQEEPNTNDETTDEEPSVVFIFDSYQLIVPNYQGLTEEINANPDKWLALAKETEYKELSAKVRAERDKLLADSDKEMAFDRLNLTIPDKITTTTLLSCVKSFFEAISAIFNSPMAKYRKALRDVPQQEAFPYDVKFPKKPNDKE